MNDFSELPKWLRWLRPKEDDIFPVFSIVAKILTLLFAGAIALSFLAFLAVRESISSAAWDAFLVSVVICLNFFNFILWRVERKILLLIHFFIIFFASSCAMINMIENLSK